MACEGQKRVLSFDFAKLISLLIVYFYHIVMDMYVLHPMHNLKVLESVLIRPNIHLAMAACGIFIFISGLTIKLNERDESIFSFYKRRLKKILIPFYFSYIIYFIVKAITFHSMHLFGGIEKWRFIYTIFGIDEYLNAAGVATFSLGVGEWFIGCIILCYIAYPFLAYFDRKSRMACFFILSIYYVLINIFYDRLNMQMPSHFNFMCQVYNFYLGIFVAGIIKSGEITQALERRESGIKKLLFVFSLILVLFLYFYPHNILLKDNFKVSLFVLSSVYLICMMDFLLVKNEFIVSLLREFSKISLEFFLVHHFVIYEVDYIIGFRQVKGIEMIMIIILELLIIVIISYVINFLCNALTKTVDIRHNK